MSSTSGDKDSTAGNPSDLYSTLAVSGGTILIVCLIWNLVRNRYPTFFYRKAYVTNFGRDPVAPDVRQADGWLNWVLYVIKYDTDNMIVPNYGGLDMSIYIKFLGYAFWFFFINMILVCAALIPTYATGSSQYLSPDDPNFVRGLNIITLSNLGENDPKTWVAFASVFWITGLFMWIMFALWRDSNRLNFLDMAKDQVRSRTVMVHNIPDNLATSSLLQSEFKRIYSDNNVVKAIVNPNLDELRELQEERKKNANKLKIVRDFMEENPDEERPQHRPKYIPGISAKVDSEKHYEGELSRLDGEIKSIRSSLVNVEENNLGVNTREGFTTFRLRSVALASAQTNHMDPPECLGCEPAPEPENVFWENLDVKKPARIIRWLISLTIVVLLFIFWAVPVTFFQGITSLDTLSRLGPFSFLGDVVNSFPQFVTGIIQGVLPSLALMIFMALLPTILKVIFSIAAPRTHTKLSNDVMKSYYAFLFINVFLVTVIAGSIFKVIQKIISDPTSTPNLLAQGISAQTTFYINYLLVNLAANFLFLSALIPFFVSRIMIRFLAKTREEKAKKEIPAPSNINIKITKELILFSIALIYLTIGPLISVFATLYFAFSYLSSKYQFMYRITPAQDGTRITPTIVTICTVTCVIYQLIMVGIFAIKFFNYGIIVLVTVPITVAWYIYLRMRYRRGIVYPPVSLLPSVEFSDEKLMEGTDMYRDPALKTPEDYNDKFEVLYLDQEHAPIDTAQRNEDFKSVRLEEGRNLKHKLTESPRPERG